MKYIVEADEHVQMISLIAVREGTAIMITGNVETFQTADKAIDEAYQKGFEAGSHEATTLEYQQGLEDGKARNENGCVGCRYDNGRIDHSPCNYCCNAYSNQWMAKEKTDKIVVGDEVKCRADDCGVVTWIYGNDAYVLWQDGSTGNYAANELVKTGRHFNFLTSLLNAMKEGAE